MGERAGDAGAGEGRKESGKEHMGDQNHPCYQALPGWFRAPSEDCIEIDVNIALPRRGSIIRLLLDADGKPLRAAIKGVQQGALHQDIEEFCVNLEACEALEK